MGMIIPTHVDDGPSSILGVAEACKELLDIVSLVEKERASWELTPSNTEIERLQR